MSLEYHADLENEEVLNSNKKTNVLTGSKNQSERSPDGQDEHSLSK
jgi:hypothetical protein